MLYHQPAPKLPPRSGPHPWHDDPETLQCIKSLIRAGITQVDIADRLGIDIHTLRYLVKRHKLSDRPYRRLGTLDLDPIISWVSEGKPAYKIARELGCAASTVQKFMDKHNIIGIPKTEKAIPDSEFDEVRRRWEAGETQAEIALSYGSHQQAVSTLFRRNGVLLMNRSTREIKPVPPDRLP